MSVDAVSFSTEDEPEYDEAKAREMLALIRSALINSENQSRLLHELAHAIVAKLGKRSWVEYHGRIEHQSQCARCGAKLNGEYVLAFDGHYWHQGNCKPTKETA